MLNILKNTINRVFASGVDSDASAFITATGLSGTTQKSAITTLVKDLKASGLWSKMKAVYPMVTDNYNLLSYTEDFTNAFWTKTNVNISLNASIAPNGTNTANSLIPTTNNVDHLSTSPYSLTTTSNTVVYSGYFKSNGYNYVSIIVPNNNSLSKYYEGIFNLSNGSVEPTSRASGYTGTRSIISVGNGWYRCSITITNADLNYTHSSWIVPLATNNPVPYAGNGTSGIYVWGAQFQMDALSTYQPILTTPSAFMASQMKYNLKDARDLDAAFRLTWSGGWTYSATGATPNGTNAYADTKYKEISADLNNFHISTYLRTNINGAFADIGVVQGANETNIISLLTGKFYARVQATEPNGIANTDSLGVFLANRTSSTQLKAIKNNVITSISNSSVGISSSNNIFIGAFNLNGNPVSYSPRQTAFSTIGNGLTDQDSQLLNQIVEKYQVALSRGVQAAQSFYYNSAYSNEANTYLYSTQIIGATQVSAINTLINGLKANNLWTKMKAVYPFVTDKSLQADMAAQMKFNLVNPQDSDAAFRLAFSGGWTYSTNGAQPNGTNGYIDTKLIGNTNVVKGNFGYGIYSRTNSTSIGAYGVDASLHIYPRYTDTNSYYRIFFNNTAGINNGTSLGLISGFNDSTNTSYSWLNAVKKQTFASPGVINSTNLMLSGNVLSTGGYDNRQLAFAFASVYLNDAEVALFYQLVQDFQTTLSRQV